MHLKDLYLTVNTNHIKAQRCVQPEESGDSLDWQLLCHNKAATDQIAAVFLDPSGGLKVRVHADPVSDQLVGDGLSRRHGQGRMGSSE